MNHSFKTFAGLLLGAVAIVGCQREPMAEPNPNFNPETNEVTAQFVLSVSTGSSSTKMSATAVQMNHNFRGIDSAKLVLFANNGNPSFVKKEGNTFKQVYNLGKLFTTGQISNTGTQNNDASSNRIMQLSIPLGSDAALFYGKAINATPGKSTGKTISHISDETPANTYFSASRRIGDEDSDVTEYDATAALMIYAINTIIKSSINAATEPYKGYSGLGPLSWEGIGIQYKKNHRLYEYSTCTDDIVTLSALAESMGMAYAEFTHIKDGEFRAGSSGAVKKMMQDMYTVISGTRGTIPLNAEEANVQRLADEIETRMNTFFNNDWTYKTTEQIKTAIGNAWITTFNGARDLNDYPYGDFNIPVGAAQLSFDTSTGRFSYKHPNAALVTPGNSFDPKKYMYAPELCYYVNSPLLVTTKENLSVSDFPNGVAPWNKDVDDAEGKWKAGNWRRDKVESGTRGVAVQKNISYGMALMETSVAWSSEVNSNETLNDNRYAMTNGVEEDRAIEKDQAHFILRGILIGGVHPRYDWQFLPRPLTSAETTAGLGLFDGVIYDDDIPNTAVPTPVGESVYTLVYDNYDWQKVTQSDVYVALEFVNNGDAFWGKDNLIPNSGIFYLGAKLTVAPKNLSGDKDANQAITWPTHYEIPPIDETTGISKKIERVFIQDFLTKVTFRIGTNSLHYAYLTIPDLRSSQMSLGLSADLEWKHGFEYDIEFKNNPGPSN